MKYFNWSKKIAFIRYNCLKLVRFVSLHPCKLCLEPVSGRALLCSHCEAALPYLTKGTKVCRQCSLPLENRSDEMKICGQCQQSPPSYAYTSCIFAYQSPISFWIKELKDQRRLAWATFFADYFMQYQGAGLNACEHICIIPSSRSKLWQRGFNPMLLIAKRLTMLPHIQLHTNVFVFEGAKEQRLLTAKQRRANLRKHLHINNPQQKITGHWLILEDVITSGATIERAAWLLKQQGAAQVGVCAIARVL